MTYSVTTSDTSKLTASINAAGDLVLTPVAGQTGSVSVTFPQDFNIPIGAWGWIVGVVQFDVVCATGVSATIYDGINAASTVLEASTSVRDGGHMQWVKVSSNSYDWIIRGQT